MNANTLRFSAGLGFAALAVMVGACNRQTRGEADALGDNRAAEPAEGGASSTAAGAGQAKNFGDTDAKRAYDQASPSGKSTTGGGSTSGPGSEEKKDVTIQQPAPAGP